MDGVVKTRRPGDDDGDGRSVAGARGDDVEAMNNGMRRKTGEGCRRSGVYMNTGAGWGMAR